MHDPDKTGDYQPEALPPHVGRYRIERVLGRGGFGLVYLATDGQLQRLVAIKVPHKDRVATAKDAETYLTEARTVANLDHPHIVPVYDLGSTDDYPVFIVSKFIEGRTLAQLIHDDRPTAREAAALVATLAEALHYAHRKGLVHRDIKPGNILIDLVRKPFVVDFGLALKEENLGRGPKHAGTPAYMSPEQARGEGHRVDGRSDIFSLGVVFYELLTGRQPFRADTQAELLEQIATFEPRPPRQFDDAIPKELERIVLKALSKRATDRYTTAKDMADDLQHFLAAAPAGWAEAAPRAAKGNLSSHLGANDQRAKIARSTFLFADFKGFTDRVRILEKAAGHQAAAEMKRKVASYIEEAFRQLEAEIKPADYQLIDTAGDGFFFHFRAARDAVRFTQALQQITDSHNSNVTDELAEHKFRAGAATGDVAWDEGKPVGNVVNIGSRLQAASAGGDLVIDQATFDALPPDLQKQFGAKEIIRDKHDKAYEVYRTAFGRIVPALPATPVPATTPVFATTPASDSHPLRIVPKGLRSFDAHDADFFLELLPGPRDRDGLQDSLRFWKTRLEEMDADSTFAVGLIYGPSGCGKSSMVKAGLLPRLSDRVIAVYVEATADETETRLRNGLRKRVPGLPTDLNLKETLALLRRGQGIPTGKKVVIILDQFEQWLHANKDEANTELVQALRQCDGGRLQAVVMVRDDFWLAVSRFLRDLEIRLVEGQNSALADLFDLDHARSVLTAFGRAFGKLPDSNRELIKDQKDFLTQAVAGLAQESKVISVRLALFAEMMKGKPWTPASLKAVGGTAGVGVTFLEETFSAATAPPEHRYHQKAARGVLQSLLPESGTDIKGHMRSHGELLAASGYANRPKDFDDLVSILDSEIRLITPTDPDGKEEGSTTSIAGEKYYQLTHDYLVPSLRDWLTRKQKETRKGRAELLLADRAAIWTARPENRQLPSLGQWLSIRWRTAKTKWTPPQRKMMRRATRFHAARSFAVVLGLALLGFAGYETHGRIQANALYGQLLAAKTSDVPGIIEQMKPYRRWVDPLLRETKKPTKKYASFEDFAVTPGDRKYLRINLALLPVDDSQVANLNSYICDFFSSPTLEELLVVRSALSDHKDRVVEGMWNILKDSSRFQERRFQVAVVLAEIAADDARWADVSEDVAAALVSQDASVMNDWADALASVGPRLIPHLGSFLVDERRGVAERGRIAVICGNYARATPEKFTRLTNQLSESMAPDASAETKLAHYKRRASIGVALLLMFEFDLPMKMLKHSPDPTIRSYMIERLGPAGIMHIWLVLKSQVVSEDVSVRRAVILSLGEFGLDRLSLAERRNYIPKLLELYENDPDPGIHGAAEWLLNQWQATAEMQAFEGTGDRQSRRETAVVQHH